MPGVARPLPARALPGSYTSDLFGDDETTYFDDVVQFFTLQREAVAELAERHAESAAWVEVTEDYRIPVWQYRKAGAGEVGGVIINLSPGGEVEVREGLVKREIDTRAAGHSGTAAPKKKARPAYSTPLCRSLAHHKSAAVQSLLLADRRKAKEVTAVLLLGASDAYEPPLRLKPHDSLRTFANADSPPAHYLAAERQCQDFAERLDLPHAPGKSPAWARLLGGRKSAPDLYEAVKALDDEALEVLLVLLPVLCFGQGDCERLDTADSLFNRVARDLDANMRDHWRPDAEFLTRRTREQLLEIAAESGLSTHRQTKKTELVQALARHFTRAAAAEQPNESQQKARDWLPEAMRFPAIDPAHGSGQDGEG
jgi:ParB family transcriptional regulator, chromosome partitioning protein